MTARAILTAAEVRAAEDALFARGVGVLELIERAGTAIAEAAWRIAGRMPALILCGPGHNGSDGYVAARVLRDLGVPVRVAAFGEPRGESARAARRRWDGAVESIADAAPAALLIDSLFGTGLARPLDPALASALGRHAAAARLRIAVDLPSGVATDSGAILSPTPAFDVTIALGVLKPAHRLQPAAALCGRVVVADIGIDAGGARLHEIARPRLPAPTPADHKYTRGYVAVVAGEMPGAAMLAAEAAARAGAGYVRLLADAALPASRAIVQGGDGAAVWGDGRVGAIVIGPGLGHGAHASQQLAAAAASGRPLILDGDALHRLGPNPVGLAGHVLTPHAGEFTKLFPDAIGTRLDRARAAAAASGAVIVYKGADTVVASPDGRAAVSAPASPWLASAGTGDVLAGVAGAMRARGLAPFESACAAVWLHGEAARIAGPALIADDLLAALPPAVAASA